VALVPFALFQFFLRGFYALQDTKTPFFVNALAVGVAIAINLVVFHMWHVQGLAAGNAFSYGLAGCALGAALNRRGGGMDLGRMARSAGRIGLASAGMGLVVWLMTTETHGLVDSPSVGPQALGLGICVVAGAATYLGFCRLLHVEELSFVTALIRR
jgi:putative peptidoglycan lipid II flippase